MSSDSDSRHVPDRGPAVFAVTTATLVLASILLAARVYSRAFIVKNISRDDKVIIFAWIISFFLSFTIDLGVVHGLGRYDTDISPENWPTLRRCEYVFSILYNPALMATKTSVLIFYLRLAKNTQVVLRYTSWATLIVVNLAGTVLTFMNIFQCRPVQSAWEAGPFDRTRCIPLLTEFICAAPVNIITDLAILAMPIPVLTGMRLPIRQKIILVFTFSLGVMVTVLDVVRIFYLQQAITHVPTGSSTDPESRFGGQADFAWNASLSFMWSAVEVNVGMICACIPTLKPLFLKLLPAMLQDPNGSVVLSSVSKGPNESDETHSTRNSGSSTIVQPSAAPVVENISSDPNAPITAIDFLTTPDMLGPSSADGSSPTMDRAHRAHSNLTNMTSSTQENAIYFGFVNMAKPKSMLRTNASESLKYCTIVSILFLLWGFSYGLLNTLNTVVAQVNGMTTAQTLGLTSAYFGGGYFFGPLLVGEWILRRDEHNRTKRHQKDETESVGGFKITFITGLCIYGCGTIIFWPSAVTNSFGGFVLSSFVVGFGLSVLEVAANCFVILCGPSEYGESRLLFAQGVQGVGSVLSGVLAQKVLFRNINGSGSSSSLTLINVQWTYLAITLLCVALALFFYYMPLPEVSDDELERLEKTLPVNPKKRCIGGLQLRTVSLILAVLAQYLYVGAQECNSIFFRSLVLSVLPHSHIGGHDTATDVTESVSAVEDHPQGIALAIPDYLLIGHTAFAVSRFLVGYLCYLSVSHPRLPKPRTLLTASVALCFLFALLPVVLRPSNPDLLVIPIILFFFAEGPIWPLLFAIGLRGQGRRTKRAAAFITMGASGAGFMQFIMYGIIVSGGTVRSAYIVVIALQAVIMITYPVFLECVRDARRMVDPCPRKLGPPDGRKDDETPMEELVMNRMLAERPKEKPARVLDKLSLGLSSKLASGHWKSSSVPRLEHNEGVRGSV
ncbi:major facilitator superfamily domain-containing protein [Stachybotrys elegans]|uniref:Major facilitator superfamily domain-containing protein n=1 Tax=Stachybotrys elegans TaxID=80388 RepID=A0A8K0WUA0_9HYPO|nr:major facilitator superfamily domain-containing protein [Stachybotrys elegans]